MKPALLNAAQRRQVGLEMAIATVACAAVPSLLVGLLFEPFPVAVTGIDGLVGFALKSTLVAVALMTTLMTLGTRAKVRKGGVPPLSRESLGPWLAWMPRALWLRVPVFAIGAALILAALTAAWAGAVALAPLERPGFVVFNVVIGALIGLGATPLIQLAAMSDRQAIGGDAAARRATPQAPHTTAEAASEAA